MKKNTSICNAICSGVNKKQILPDSNIDEEKVKIIMISEAPPINDSDYFYENEEGAFFQTTKQAFNDAGIKINSYIDLEKLGIYLTTAIKCRKLDYLVPAKYIKECAMRYLGKEILKFNNLKIIMCMGDFAIKAVNYIYISKYNKKPICSGSTYKIRNKEHFLNGIHFLPSYTQTGNSFNIEKSKRRMIAEDIKKAFKYLEQN